MILIITQLITWGSFKYLLKCILWKTLYFNGYIYILKSFHLILCKSKYSRLNFSGTFLFTNLPAFNSAVIDTDCAKNDGGAAVFLALVTFEVNVTGTEKLPGVDETNLPGGAALCFLFS